ncbi:hypothetical protein H0486_11530 [Lachnospiraceae bacterium MD1]|uniref:Uncharacterized protein n=1 Tax=Variimorphobacter saccharofermentans TaxID=2755051 RepID=A0A839K3C5_9FIRM|nr:hypothetical protein [Variimorphobacter saccharofermentans]MBB2183509.1 hypothetical protein [Variimorphobacter saccharofermentans]
MFFSKPVWLRNELSKSAEKKLRYMLSEGQLQQDEKFHILDVTPCQYTKHIIMKYMQAETLLQYLLIGNITENDLWLLADAKKVFMMCGIPYRDLLPTKAVSQTVRDYFSPQLPAASDDDSADVDMKQIWHDYDMKQGY